MTNLLDELTTLAQDPHPDRRRDLLRAVSDMFLENDGRCTDRESALVDDVMTRVLDQVEVTARIELSTKLSNVDFAPRDTIVKLANDVSSAVAGPVLQHSTVLTEEDLASIAETRPDGHMLAIARRQTVSERLTEVLVRRGSKSVLHTVTENEGARFSDRSFEELARRAKDDKGLQMRLAVRTDVPDDVLDGIMPILADELRDRLKGQGIEDAVPPYLLVRLRQRLGNVMTSRMVEERQLGSLVEDIREGRRNLADTVIELCERERQADVAYVLASFAGIAVETALGALTGAKRETLVILLRSLDLSRGVYEAILNLEARRRRQPYVADVAALSRFESVAPSTAQRAIRFHKVRATAMAS